MELELVPQDNGAERLRAGGAGIGGYFTPTGAGIALARGKATRAVEGRLHVFEHPIRGDLRLIKAERGDRRGKLTHRQAARNFEPVMATPAKRTVASEHQVVARGQIGPCSRRLFPKPSHG